MRVRLLYFGVLREMFGGREAVLEMEEGAIVADVLNVYRKHMPAFAWDSIAVAVNQEYARAEDLLKEGDEVALLPPVSGGLPQGLKPLSCLVRGPRLKPWVT